MMRTIHKFINSTISVAGIATFTTLGVPAIASAQGDDNYQVYSLQQSLRATNARVDQLEKELSRLRSDITRALQQPVSYTTETYTSGNPVQYVTGGENVTYTTENYRQ